MGTLNSVIKTGMLLAGLLMMSNAVLAADTSAQSAKVASSAQDKQVEKAVDHLKKPLYTPFIERYVLDDLKQLRVDMNNLRVDMTKEVTDRELTATNRAVNYATDTVTYFFYLIAGISSVLLLVGWTSLREVKERVLNLADSKVNAVVSQYEGRLAKLEQDLQKKSVGIYNAQKKLEQHQDIHSLWLKAGQEQILSNRLDIYDQILELDPENGEAMTYKADVALEMDEPQWAINLCNQALSVDPENKHAFYQLAGAYTLLDQPNEALSNLEKALKDAEGMADEVVNDPIFASLLDNPKFKELLSIGGENVQGESDTPQPKT
ncbi:tetratricopeptide repeat protein [Hydrogenovibrio kuenenii]|uniref:tetratricopeptide repeat protein n=1 Tax=Hydrogenovibrio kuenenii TaxID=63658 RepID=UPI0004645139|nr:tetratricopeptide repeat protein [Hydrogenovibrio kuenenii]